VNGCGMCGKPIADWSCRGSIRTCIRPLAVRWRRRSTASGTIRMCWPAARPSAAFLMSVQKRKRACRDGFNHRIYGSVERGAEPLALFFQSAIGSPVFRVWIASVCRLKRRPSVTRRIEREAISGKSRQPARAGSSGVNSRPHTIHRFIRVANGRVGFHSRASD
jgi:hypothetical protein